MALLIVRSWGLLLESATGVAGANHSCRSHVALASAAQPQLLDVTLHSLLDSAIRPALGYGLSRTKGVISRVDNKMAQVCKITAGTSHKHAAYLIRIFVP